MAKITNDMKEKIAIKKAAAKAKKAAKRAARLEKKRKQAEAKKAKREAKKAKKLAKLEKEKAKKAALKEKKRLAKEKAKSMEKVKITKVKITTIDKTTAKPEIDIKEAAKNIKAALNQIAIQMAQLPKEKRVKKAKAIYWMGYDVESVDGNVVVRFYPEKTKKSKVDDVDNTTVNVNDVKTTDAIVDAEAVEVDNCSDVDEDESQSVETVPAGDLYGQNGQVNDAGEIANIDIDDDSEIDDGNDNDDDDDDDGDDDISIPDSRDEQDEELIGHREEFFSQYGEDFEPNDD